MATSIGKDENFPNWPSIRKTTVSTTHGTLSVISTGPETSQPLLMLHGNSFSSKIFRPIFASSLAKSYYLLALDLPGHGSSTNAPDPEASYNQPAYADAMLQALSHLGLASVVVFGWSLGGHIALEMINAKPDAVRAAMIIGTPPVNPGSDLAKAFLFGRDAQNSPAAKDILTPEEAEGFAHMAADAPYEEWMLADVKRTDGIARKLMFAAFGQGAGSHQRDIVGRSELLIAVVNGKEEPFVSLEYVRGVQYGRLWKGECIELESAKHASFWGNPEKFLGLLGEFLNDVEKEG
jgi:pimeloyl-ACP methyl ester carboxylesterase